MESPVQQQVVSPQGVAPFLWKTYQIVNSNSPGVSWNETGTSFVVWKPDEFAAKVLPLYFKHSNFCSFVRQLNIYGFRKLDDKRFEFGHEKFVRGNIGLLAEIPRRKSVKREKAQEGASAEPIDDDADETADNQFSTHHPHQQHQHQQQHQQPQHITHQHAYGSTTILPTPTSASTATLAAEVDKLRRQQEVTVAILQRVVKELEVTKRRCNRLQDQCSGLTRLLSVLIPSNSFQPIPDPATQYIPPGPTGLKKDASSTLTLGGPLPDTSLPKFDVSLLFPQQEAPLEVEDQEGIDRLLRDLMLEQHGFTTSPPGSTVPQ